METVQKQVVTQEVFNKRVDTAAAYMEYMNRMKAGEARAAALAEVSQTFAVQ